MALDHFFNVHAVNKRDGCQTQRNQNRLPWFYAIVGTDGNQYTIGSSSQELSSHADSEVAMRIREKQMTEATLEYPDGMLEENRKSGYMQRTKRLQPTPLWTANRNVQQPAVSARNTWALNAVP